jgi:uncharacterized membrane protein YkvA (DUF1232 family)
MYNFNIHHRGGDWMSRTRKSQDLHSSWDIALGLVQDLRLAWRLLQDSRVPWLVKAVPVAAMAYIVSPIDFAPDFLLGLGQLDDLAILLLGLKAFISLSPRDVVEQHLRNLARPRGMPAQDGDEVEYVNAEYRVLRDDE